MNLKNRFRTLCNYSEHCWTIPRILKEFRALYNNSNVCKAIQSF